MYSAFSSKIRSLTGIKPPPLIDVTTAGQWGAVAGLAGLWMVQVRPRARVKHTEGLTRMDIAEN